MRIDNIKSTRSGNQRRALAQLRMNVGAVLLCALTIGQHGLAHACCSPTGNCTLPKSEVSNMDNVWFAYLPQHQQRRARSCILQALFAWF